MRNSKKVVQHAKGTTGSFQTPATLEAGWLPGFIVGGNVARQINALPSGKDKTALQNAMNVLYSYGEKLIAGFSAPIEA